MSQFINRSDLLRFIGISKNKTELLNYINTMIPIEVVECHKCKWNKDGFCTFHEESYRTYGGFCGFGSEPGQNR